MSLRSFWSNIGRLTLAAAADPSILGRVGFVATWTDYNVSSFFFLEKLRSNTYGVYPT